MLLYSGQLVRQSVRNQVLLYLGHDAINVNKVWVVKIDHNDKPVIDWFMTNNLDYIQIDSKNPALPDMQQIAYGKYKTKASVINCVYEESSPPTAEDMLKYGNYLRELTTKYEEKKVTN